MKMLEVIYHTLDERKGEHIEIIDISEISVMADYFVIVNASNENHLQALVDHLDEKLSRLGYKLHSQEGHKRSNWILMDYGDVIVHLFDRESREFYSLDRIWSDGKKITFTD